MNEPRTIAWIFYATELASGKGAADFHSISQLADGINHAVPTQKEMHSSLSWLRAAGLVMETSRKFQITAKGRDILSSAHADSTTTSQVWVRLAQEIEELLSK